MTVHTIRQAKALQRAHAHWKHVPTNHLARVPLAPPPRRTLGDRIAALGERLDNSRLVWAVIGLAAAVLYIVCIVTHWPHP
jgi:hypothetical protein